MTKKAIFKMAAATILNFKDFNFFYVTVIRFIKIGLFFTEIWRFNDFQNGGRPLSWLFKNCSFCHVAVVGMRFCFLIQNVAKIGHSVDELWPKKRFSRRRTPPS